MTKRKNHRTKFENWGLIWEEIGSKFSHTHIYTYILSGSNLVAITSSKHFASSYLRKCYWPLGYLMPCGTGILTQTAAEIGNKLSHGRVQGPGGQPPGIAVEGLASHMPAGPSLADRSVHQKWAQM